MAAFYETEMAARCERPLSDGRQETLCSFCARLGEGASTYSLLEVGCGAGRDGRVLASAAGRYVGVDTSFAGVSICREAGLDAYVASATALPFRRDQFDAAWSMSTFMHLPDLAFAEAISELHRVCRHGAEVVVGLWGGASEHTFVDGHGRYFHHRTDEVVRRWLSALGRVTSFATWDYGDDGGHYQCASVRVS